jgi:iron complex transport system ATP-binding protein
VVAAGHDRARLRRITAVQAALRPGDADLRGERAAGADRRSAGKSTAPALLSGDLTPAAGQVRLDGTALETWSPVEQARRRAVLPQRNAVTFPFTVADVVAIGRAPWRGTPAEAEDRSVIARALAATEMTGFADRRFPTLVRRRAGARGAFPRAGASR